MLAIPFLRERDNKNSQKINRSKYYDSNRDTGRDKGSTATTSSCSWRVDLLRLHGLNLKATWDQRRFRVVYSAAGIYFHSFDGNNWIIQSHRAMLPQCFQFYNLLKQENKSRRILQVFQSYSKHTSKFSFMFFLETFTEKSGSRHHAAEVQRIWPFCVNDSINSEPRGTETPSLARGWDFNFFAKDLDWIELTVSWI